MTKNRVGRLVSIAAVLLLTLGVVAGCSDDEPSAEEPTTTEEPSSEEANAQVCDAHEDLQASLQGLADLDPETVTKDDLQATGDEIGDSLSEFEESAREVAKTETDDVRTAFDDFRETIDGLDEDESLSEFADDIVTTATQLGVAFRALFDKAGCD